MNSREEILLELFVQGQSAHSSAAMELVRRVCESYLHCPYGLEIIDIQQYPERARAAGIIAAPALVRRSPQPVVRLVGRLTEERLLTGLGIKHA